MASEIKANKISPATGTAFTLGDSGDTFTIPSGTTLDIASGATLANNGTASGFGSPAYASNASATDDTVNVDASNNLQFNSGYGSTVTAFGVRAWVNFDGTGTLSVKASGNVSSVTDNGAADYTVNLTTAMPDIDYAISVNARYDDTGWGGEGSVSYVNTTSAFRIRTYDYPGAHYYDMQDVWAIVVR